MTLFQLAHIKSFGHFFRFSQLFSYTLPDQSNYSSINQVEEK